MAYGAECWALRKNHENRLQSGMRLLISTKDRTRKDHVRNQVTQEKDKSTI